MQIALFFLANDEFTHIIVDASAAIADGADEESAADWAYEKFGNGRECIGVEAGTDAEIAERIELAHAYSVLVAQ